MRSIRAIVLTMLLGTQAACLGKFGLHAPAVETEAAKALVPAERSVMLQPEQDMQSGVGIDFIEHIEAEHWSDGTVWRSPYAFFGLEPKRIELAPGKQRFNYHGGQSYLNCTFDVSLAPGHVYKPRALNFKGIAFRCNDFPCTITLSDTAPDGRQTDLELDCLND